jgi:ribulose-phosphate 3-epimerase
MKAKIAPSILAADFLNIQKEIEKMKKAKVEIIHFDVMDGHFVPNITFGVDFIKSIRKCCDMTFDVHLMVTDPDKFIPLFAQAGADVLLFHREVSDFPLRSIKTIKSLNKKAGITLNPVTKLETIESILPEIDQVLLMSVEPGFYGQKFIPFVLKKIESLKNIIVKNNYKTLIEVDGGINDKNKNDVISAGADILVMGAGFFKTK